MVTAQTALLADGLAAALQHGDEALWPMHDASPASRRDRFLALLQIYDLHRCALHEVGDRVRWQHHPAVAAVKQRLESEWIEELDRSTAVAALGDTADELRALAAHDRAPAIYRWLAKEADWESTMYFLALECGPDDVFDDLVATCQVGLPLGPAKMELAANYWDEMGNGSFDDVHNVLYQRFVEAVGLPEISRAHQPTEALERSALLGLLAVNRALQPEMIGALGLIELEAGPHCRYVDQGLGRLGASEDARAFYQMHAVVDPLHGAGWVENAVAPLAERQPDWGPRILRGARWKSAVNNAFFTWAQRTLIRDAA